MFLKYAENQTPVQFSHTGGQLYIFNDNSDTSGQITHRENVLQLNKNYTAYNSSIQAMIDGPATFKGSPESLKRNAGLMESTKDTIKVTETFAIVHTDEVCKY